MLSCVYKTIYAEMRVKMDSSGHGLFLCVYGIAEKDSRKQVK